MVSGCNAQQSRTTKPTNRTGCNPFRCARCGYSYAEDLVNAEPGLQAIIDGWHAIDGATARCDREQAQTGLDVLFTEAGRTPPVVRWRVCPVAMLVAHDVEMLGLPSAGMMHGPDVIGCSVELAQWLDGEGVGTRQLGAPMLMQFVADLVRSPPRRGSGEAACARSQLPSLLTRWAVPLVISRDIEQGVRDALESSPAARNAAWFS